MRDTLEDVLARPWRVTAVAVGGLLAAIIVAGLLGFLLNRHIARAAEQTLRYDVEVEDHGHDLQTAVLEVRHRHRNIAFLGNSPASAAGLEQAYELLRDEIDEYEEMGVREPGMVRPEEFRRMAARYYEGFRPAVNLAEADREEFARESDLGLARLQELKDAADGVDVMGEKLAERSLRDMQGAATASALVLLAAICGLVLVGAALAYAAVRVVNQLRDFSRAKTEFLADVSHELRTPLTVLRGNAEVGLSLGDGGCAHEKMLKKIVQESVRMSRMVEDLLFLARSDSAVVPLSKEAVAVAPLLAELAERAEVLLGERGCAFETNLRAEGYLDADRAKVEQAVMAVVDNAAKYGCPGGKVRLSSASEGGCLRVEVADEGPGIPEGDLPRIFERFYRPDKARSRALGGAGLGLSIARTIIEAHGGRIRADSRVGEGTEVSIHLPLCAAGSDETPGRSRDVKSTEKSHAARPESSGGGRRARA